MAYHHLQSNLFTIWPLVLEEYSPDIVEESFDTTDVSTTFSTFFLAAAAALVFAGFGFFFGGAVAFSFLGELFVFTFTDSFGEDFRGVVCFHLYLY